MQWHSPGYRLCTVGSQLILIFLNIWNNLWRIITNGPLCLTILYAIEMTLNNPGFAEVIPNIYPPWANTQEDDWESCACFIFRCKHFYKFCTSAFDKRVTFNFHIVNFPFLAIVISLHNRVYISRISRICDEYHKFVERHYLITSSLLQQGFKF